MAERLVNWPDRSTPTIYPWDEWLDGSVWRLNPGEDFKCALPSVRLYAYRAASERRVKVRTSKDGDSLLVQALQPTTSKEGQ